MEDIEFRKRLFSLKADDALNYMIDERYDHKQPAINLMNEANGLDWDANGPIKLVALITSAIAFNLKTFGLN